MRILRLCRHGLYLLAGALLGGVAFFLVALIITQMLLEQQASLFHEIHFAEAPVSWTASLAVPVGVIVGIAFAETLYDRAKR